MDVASLTRTLFRRMARWLIYNNKCHCIQHLLGNGQIRQVNNCNVTYRELMNAIKLNYNILYTDVWTCQHIIEVVI
jgi:hypothetical protein